MNFPIIFCAGSLAVLGIGYFGLDLYRNRNRPLSRFEDSGALSNIGIDASDLTQAAHSASHAVEVTDHGIEQVVGHCVEAIAHTLSHH
jgi:hypothetical protein